jgi:hypothetical protein
MRCHGKAGAVRELRIRGLGMTDRDAIKRCVIGAARSKDGRGVAQCRIACAVRLARTTTPLIARETAAAAARFGEWLRGRG